MLPGFQQGSAILGCRFTLSWVAKSDGGIYTCPLALFRQHACAQARLSLLSEQDLRLLLFYIVTIDPSAIVQLLRPISSLVGVPSGDAQYSMVQPPCMCTAVWVLLVQLSRGVQDPGHHSVGGDSCILCVQL